jgi:hypothetical protein
MEEHHELAQALESALGRVLDSRKRVDEETHRVHHEYVARCIDRDRKREKRWEQLRVHILGWGAISVIGSIIYSLGDWIKHVVINLFKVKGGP